MNPSNNEQSGINLPVPTFEIKNSAPKESGLGPEVAKPLPQPSLNTVNPIQVSTKPTNPKDNLNNASGASNDTPLDTQSLTPPAANDTDLIEKEWVNKAKQIVDKTKEDPHQQTNEMNQFKADYIKKRYNKDIKIVDE